MDNKGGKTIRSIDKGRNKDTYIVVNMKNANEDSTEILGHEFHLGLQYSMKKKQRWQLSSELSKNSYDGDTPILITKHQCIHGGWPLLDLYLHDSVSNKTIGSGNISNRQLEKGRINMKSAINQLENGDNYTQREKNTFAKLRNKKMKNKKISQISNGDLHTIDDQLQPKTEYSFNKELRHNCVYFSEYVHVNDLSRVNMIRPSNYRHWYNPNTKKRILIDQLSDIDYEYDDEDYEAEIDNFEEVNKPFIIEGKDFVCRTKTANPKRKKQKYKKSFTVQKPFLDKDRLIDITENIEQRVEINIYDDLLPMVVTELSCDQFHSELQMIVSFCKCWKSSGSPFTILVDLDGYEESREKSFILLRPNVQRSENLISVKVLFNVSNNGFDKRDVLDNKFESLLSMVTFVQSRLRSGTGEKLLTLSKVVMLDGSINALSNLPNVSNVDNVQYLYLHHSEWKNYELNSSNLETLKDFNENLNFSMDECDLCDCVIPDDEIVIMVECGHRVCDSCLSHHIAQILDTHNHDMTCPCNGCVVRLGAPTLLSLVSWQHYRLRLDMLESTVFDRCGKPCHECESVLISVDNCEKMKNKTIEYVCQCGKTVCNNCGQLQHWPSSCREMMEHNVKMVELQDKMKSPSIIRSNKINCANCKETIVRYWTKPNLRCPCNNVFCTNCRFSYKKHITECQVFTEDKSTFPNSTTIIPFQEAKSSALKLYNQSVYLRLLLRKDNLDRFKQNIFGIMSSAVVTGPRSYSVKELTGFYSQVLIVLESMYVSAYNTYRKDNPQKLYQLKVATNHLLFCVDRIQTLTGEICDFLNRKGQVRAKEEMRYKYNKLESYIDNARLYAKKTMTLLKF